MSTAGDATTGGIQEATLTLTEDEADAPSKTCFIVCPIGDNNSEIRKFSNQVKTHIIDVALTPLGYETTRADVIDKSGNITTQIVNQLIEADLVIADLTGHNPNVFYELAIRHAFAKPFIHLMQDGESIPFDVAQYRTVFLDYKDLDSAAAARSQITEMTKDIEAEQAAGRTVETPVVHAVNRQALGASSNPEQQEIAQIGETVERVERLLRPEAASRKISRVRDSPSKFTEVLMDIIERNVLSNRPIEYSQIERAQNLIPEEDAETRAWARKLLDVLPPF
ncbi:hypothetical protein A2J03_25700 [Rhodococcus sp. EPR-157]|jgi:hypothetical protein|uniref:hypothetical protein n=1 Tax=Rhodococcus sp. EPR-157 TaxID=1813677 RepID=UPI0007BB3FC6|nr:hypothetical protein [Rhodococcus sp. EPR-157]KZF04788.1 hypothetical protein A2J03_25700 [Rhodococcus sp. EPR-157]